MSSNIISGPVPPFNNPPIHPEFFQPRRFFISNITLGLSTTVTTTVDQDFVIGQEVRLLIPPTFGCTQLNYQTGFVTSIPMSNQVIVSIDSTKNVDPFKNSSAITQPQIIPIGDINQGAINALGRFLTSPLIPGSFENISPV